LSKEEVDAITRGDLSRLDPRLAVGYAAGLPTPWLNPVRTLRHPSSDP
jgi:hypothetical protein